MIKFHCPHCDQKISVETESAGAAIQCPTCGGDIVVPAASDEAPQEEVVSEVREENRQVKNADAVSDSSSQPDQAGAGQSFTDRIKTGTKDGWAGIKRHSKQAALIAQAEKLRTVDLRMALHSLGKKCFETGILADVLAEQFQAIRDLDVSIAEKREKGETVSDESRMATLKRIGKDAAKASHAQALVLTRYGKVEKAVRERLLEVFVAEDLVRLDGKMVIATNYDEFVSSLHARKVFPEPTNHWVGATGEADAA